MKLITFLLKRSPRWMLGAIFAGAISGLCSAGLLAIINSAITRLELHQDPKVLIPLFLGLCLLSPVSSIIAQYLLLLLGQNTVVQFRVRMTRSILATPLARLEKVGGHRLLATLTDDVGQLGGSLVLVPGVAINAFMVVGCLVYLGWLSMPLFGALLVTIIIGAITYQLPILAGMRRFRESREERDTLFDHFKALADGVQELKLHRQRSREFVTLVDRSASILRTLQIGAMMIFNLAAVWGNLLFFVVIGVLVFFVPLWQEVEPSTVRSYALVVMYMVTPLQAMMQIFPNLGQASVALDKVEKLGLSLDEPLVERGDGDLAVDPGWRELSFKGVTYEYTGEDEDENFAVGPFDLQMHSGELVFLVGGNGSGKTTFAKLLTGLYTPKEGEIQLDGEPVTDDLRDDYRQFFSTVFSKPFLFEELLGFDRNDDFDTKVRGYLEQLHLSGKLTVQGGKLSTTALSDGQRKRLALMVSYLEDRPIYVFDEWAADQDPEFREVFYRSILAELKARGKTVIVISHDDRYYPLADRIVKLDYGRVRYDGPYSGSPYATGMADRQANDAVAEATVVPAEN